MNCSDLIGGSAKNIASLSKWRQIGVQYPKREVILADPARPGPKLLPSFFFGIDHNVDRILPHTQAQDHERDATCRT